MTERPGAGAWSAGPTSVDPSVDPSLGLDAVFAPRSLAVIGASRQAGKLGHDVLVHCARLGFEGRLYGVNPRFDGDALVSGRDLSGDQISADQMSSVRLVPDLGAIEEPVDLALIAVPAGAAVSVVADCARAGVTAAIVAASGLGELGGEGQAAEAEMLAVAAGTGMRLLGPNGFGLYVAGAGINLTTYEDIPAGRVALLTQSGNVAIALSRLASKAGLGFSCCVGVGNQLDVGFGDLASYLVGHDLGDVVALYIEGVVPGDGHRLRAAVEASGKAGRPVVVLRGGRTAAGARAAVTHTGALGDDDRIWDAMLTDSGAIGVGSTEEMVDVLAALATGAPARGRTMVLTDGGGDSVLAVDALQAAGIPLAQLTPETITAIDRITPPAAPRVQGRNPVTLDTAGGLQDDPALVARGAEIAAGDPGVDVVVVAGTFGGYRAQRATELAGVERLIAVHRSGTPVLVQSAFAGDPEEPVLQLRAGGIAVYPTAPRLAGALAAVLAVRGGDPSAAVGAGQRGGAGASMGGASVAGASVAGASVAGASVAGASMGGGSMGRPPGRVAGFTLLGVDTAARMLRGAGIDVPPMTVVTDDAGLADAAEAVGFPVCLKISQVGVVHKSDVDGVRLGVERATLPGVAAELWSRFPTADLVVMPMLRPGVELLLGAAHDPTFGPFVTVGRGGVTAELDPDVTVLLAPVTAVAARRAWLGLRSAARLTGWRGSPAIDLEALATLTRQLAAWAADRPGLAIDLNPVIAYPVGYAVADLRAAVVA